MPISLCSSWLRVSQEESAIQSYREIFLFFLTGFWLIRHYMSPIGFSMSSVRKRRWRHVQITRPGSVSWDVCASFV